VVGDVAVVGKGVVWERVIGVGVGWETATSLGAQAQGERMKRERDRKRLERIMGGKRVE
jgi:hypothetical protein